MSPRVVLITEGLGDEGLDRLRQEPNLVVETATGLSPAELLDRVREIDALIVRSATKVTAEVIGAAKNLRVVVRAGVGTDNIALDAATARGIVVMNTPGGNTNAAVEHTLALLLALVRHIPLASAVLRDGGWERERFLGRELSGRRLGVIGLGRIGTEVAARARAFGMDVVGHDPFLNRETAEARGIPLLPLAALLAAADVVTLHLPLSDATHHILGRAQFAAMKAGAFVVNCARGGLIDESALLDALDSGQLQGAALDVFEAEPRPDARLVTHPRIVATPHLGASTEEAKAAVGMQAARQTLGVLNATSFENAVNVPLQDASVLVRLAPLLHLVEKLGAFLTQLVEGEVREAAIEVSARVEDLPPVRLAFLKGLFTPLLGASVNYVNASYLAEQRGLRVREGCTAPRPDVATRVTTTVVSDRESLTVAGTLLAGGEPRLVSIAGVAIDAIPSGHLLLLRSRDRPGVVGEIGTCLGAAGISISEFRLGRPPSGQEAWNVVTLDAEPASDLLDRIRALPSIRSARPVRL